MEMFKNIDYIIFGFTLAVYFVIGLIFLGIYNNIR